MNEVESSVTLFKTLSHAGDARQNCFPGRDCGVIIPAAARGFIERTDKASSGIPVGDQPGSQTATDESGSPGNSYAT